MRKKKNLEQKTRLKALKELRHFTMKTNRIIRGKYRYNFSLCNMSENEGEVQGDGVEKEVECYDAYPISG